MCRALMTKLFYSISSCFVKPASSANDMYSSEQRLSMTSHIVLLLQLQLPELKQSPSSSPHQHSSHPTATARHHSSRRKEKKQSLLFWK
jgi:hypothetical protein